MSDSEVKAPKVRERAVAGMYRPATHATVETIPPLQSAPNMFPARKMLVFHPQPSVKA